jgi:hypothetical protein
LEFSKNVNTKKTLKIPNDWMDNWSKYSNACIIRMIRNCFEIGTITEHKLWFYSQGCLKRGFTPVDENIFEEKN